MDMDLAIRHITAAEILVVTSASEVTGDSFQRDARCEAMNERTLSAWVPKLPKVERTNGRN